MPSRYESEIEIVVIDRAAGIARIDTVDPLTRKIGGKLVHGDKRRAGILAHCHDIAGVILMAVGQRRVGDALDGPGERNSCLLEGRVPGEERVDQDARLTRIDAEAGMAEPGDLHGVSRITGPRRPGPRT